MSDDLGVLPIEPGSPLDLALNSVVRNMIDRTTFNLDAFQLVSLSSPAHMLALGTRIWCYKGGVREPSNLVSALHRQWYGQAADGDRHGV